jgi:hypothetical protein
VAAHDLSIIVRHDVITLRNGAKEEDFEKFMKEELIPFFSETFMGPTRAALAYIQSQSLLKNTKCDREWLWVTVWEANDGNSEYVRGSFFEHTFINDSKGLTDAILARLQYFGERTTEDVFSEVSRTEVATNP